MLDEVHRQGAEAARRGLSLWHSPYVRAEAMPAHSGEPIGDWMEKVTSWEAGWKAASIERERMPPKEIHARRKRAQREEADRKLELSCFHSSRGTDAGELPDPTSDGLSLKNHGCLRPTHIGLSVSRRIVGLALVSVPGPFFQGVSRPRRPALS
ncbi:CrpP-related protein [Achromobacter sp. AGC39]